MIILGNCIEVMQTLEANSVDTIITDPPYGLEFMGKEWDKLQCKQWRSDEKEAWQDNHPESHIGNRMTKMPRYGHEPNGIQKFHYEWALQALRIAKPGAFMLCFGGTRTFHRIACGIEDAGWEIRDTMMWLYGSGFPKSHNIGKKLDGWDGSGTALKPAFEPIIVAMKPRDGTFAENALKYGVAGLHIDGARVHNKDVSEERTRHGGGKKWEGSNYNPDRKNVQPAGRFPANIIHDGSEEVLAGFPQTKSGSMSGTYNNTIMDGKAGVRDGKPIHLEQQASSGSAARFFYCAKASKAERNARLEGMEDVKGGMVPDRNIAKLNRNNKVPLMKNNHPTVKPLSLMEYLCRLTSTPTGGTVLDPFMGSGTTLMACKKTGRDFIGIELDEHYFEIAEKRIASVIQVELL